MNFHGPLVILTLLYMLTPSSAENFKLTLFHTNDVHSHYDEFNKYGSACSENDAKEGKCFGGVARLAAALKDLKLKYPHSLLLDGGDQSHGTVWYTALKEKIVAHFMNELKYDAMAIGNHAFDLGDEQALALLKEVNFTMLSANVNFSLIPEAAQYLLPSAIFTVNGQQIGIIGYVTTETPVISNPGRFVITDEVAAVKVEVARLKSLGINKIIALGHGGIEIDLAIARQVEGVDVVVGGHTNTFLYTGEPPAREKPENTYPIIVTQDSGAFVAVVQDFQFAKYLGVLHVTFNESGALIGWSGNPILLDKKYSQDPEVKSDLEKWKAPVTKYLTVVLGETAVLLDNENCRVQECNVGNMIADSFIQYFIGKGDPGSWTPVAASLVNSGSIRVTIPICDQLVLQPFENTMDIVVMEGRHLRLVLEHSVGPQYDDGGFMQVAGLQVLYDVSRAIGERVVQVKIRCANCSVPQYYPLEDYEEYPLVVSSFIQNGGDGFSHFKKYAKKRVIAGVLDTDLLTTYIKKFSPVSPGLEGRIIIQNGSTSTTTTQIPSTADTSIVTPTTDRVTVKGQGRECVCGSVGRLHAEKIIFLMVLFVLLYNDVVTC